MKCEIQPQEDCVMTVKKWISLLAALALLTSLAGCSSDGAIYVQSVESLTGMGGIAPGDRFAGLVVSEHVAEIRKDGDRRIAELLVKEGDDVKEGDSLFCYDTDELQLNLDKQRLEMQQLLATIDNHKAQINDLENQSRGLTGTEKLQYTVQIQSLQVDLKESELKIISKETEIQRSEEILEHAGMSVEDEIDALIKLDPEIIKEMERFSLYSLLALIPEGAPNYKPEYKVLAENMGKAEEVETCH
jgi:HlyD family secretion protein